jgi:hypothetical protein
MIERPIGVWTSELLIGQDSIDGIKWQLLYRSWQGGWGSGVVWC